ncbi:hypothetical protein RND81_12G009600 [Saponaria officinalis]|uniref:C2 domain-containing protein n=1 Tax=Saponaria officinalis TaxID=3572 RepID=A0AAW1H4A4_SAPOF
MECRTIDLSIISAQDLKKASIFSSKMEPYVVVSVYDSMHINHRYSSLQQHKTPVDKTGNKNPRWNFPIKFTLDDAALQGNHLTFHFELFSRHALLPDTLIGEVHVPVSELISSVGKSDVSHVSYQVRKRSGKPKGVLNFSYKFGEKFTSAPPPATRAGPSMAYPPQPASGYPAPQYVYPAQPAGVGYAYPAPVNGYGYGYGYGAPQQVVQPQGRRNNFGMGMGTGLLGGALAGLVVGDLVSDMGHDGGYYDDGGFDGGYDDGGFDFGGF